MILSFRSKTGKFSGVVTRWLENFEVERKVESRYEGK